MFVFVNNGQARKMTPTANGGTWATVGPWPPAGFTGYLAATAYDTTRNRIFIAKGGVGYPSVGNKQYFVFDGSTYSEVIPTGSRAVLDNAMTSPGMVYVPQLDAYLVRLMAAGGEVIKIDAGTFNVSLLPTTAGGSVPAAPDVNAGTNQYENVYTWFLYVPALQGVVYVPTYTGNAWFLRLY